MISNHYGLIYKVTNIYNRKIYIGQTSRSLVERKCGHRYATITGSKHYFHLALRKYGFDMFKWEILGYCDSKEELLLTEVECIWFFDSNNPIYGYNQTKGGDATTAGFKHSMEEVERMRERGRIQCTGSGNNMYGKTHTPEAREKISKARKGKSGPWKNKPLPDYMKKHLSEVRKEKALFGSKSPAAKKVEFISPLGQKYIVHGMFNPFCKEHKLDPERARALAKGRRNSYKGWKIRYIDEKS